MAAANVATNAAPATDAPCAAALLRWGNDAHDAAACCGGEPAESSGHVDREAEAAARRERGRFDIVIGGDLIYDDDHAAQRVLDLVRTVDNLLSHAPGAHFLLVRFQAARLHTHAHARSLSLKGLR
jgi:hypothetical protein